jgi:16S rRNA (cytosine1402-N4)-methyltransferase
MTWQHTTVLLSEAVDSLLTQPDQTYVDATFGRGGHSRLILSRLAPAGRLIAFDKDPDAIRTAQAIDDARFSIRHEGFAHLAGVLQDAGERADGRVAGVLMDLGVSSPQIDNPERGFSFRTDGPLDMRMDSTRGQSVAEWLAVADQQQIAEVIRDYGEERFAVPIAKAIVARRQAGSLPASTLELAEIVAGAVKTRESGQNPATRTFQAFRIFINAELEELQQALEASLDVLQPGGRLVVISFHSLEDRIVKQFIAKHAREVVDRRSPGWMLNTASAMKLESLGRIKPSAEEVARNPRSRSAVMRVAQRTAA